jgi:hypothetical protein
MNLTTRPLMRIRINTRLNPLARIPLPLRLQSQSLFQRPTNLQIFGCHGNHNRLFLLGINVLDDAGREEIVLVEAVAAALFAAGVEGADVGFGEY